MNYKDIANDVV